jgi:hypothetical protein
MRLQLDESVQLIRAPRARTVATVWADGVQDAISDKQRGSLEDICTAESRFLVGKFIDDWRRAKQGER